MSTFAPLSPYFVKNIILSALQNLPAAALDKLAAFSKTKCSLSSIKGVLIDESNRNCQTDRRPWPRCHSQGDPPHHENPRGRPVTDNIGTVGKILLRHAGSVKKMGSGLYIVTEDAGKAVGIREGWNGGKRMAARCSHGEKAGAPPKLPHKLPPKLNGYTKAYRKSTG